MRHEKKIVKDFYENYGWTRTDTGLYKDTAAFVDTRAVMKSYHQRAMRRLSSYFYKGGNRFLDAGCGALASDAYAAVGAPFQQRVCVDISVNALRGAREKLGDGVLYVVADIAALPFRDATFDGLLCAHVLYHLPPEEQAPVVAELGRVMGHGGIGVIVYTWATCLFTRTALMLNPRVVLPRIPGMRWIWRRFFKRHREVMGEEQAPLPDVPPLYFQPQNYLWYREHLAKQGHISLACWQAVSLPFSQAYVLDARFGGMLLSLISWLEDHFPALMGRLGAYPQFVLRKK